jgi:L-lactate utilization protein LutC
MFTLNGINKDPLFVSMMTNSYISRLEQYRHEHHTWDRLLAFFKQENAYLKTRLSEVLDRDMDKDFLALAEHFQNQFIVKDEFIDILKHDINEMTMILKQDIIAARNIPDKRLEARQNKLRDEVDFLEKNFTELKKEFNNYLVSLL